MKTKIVYVMLVSLFLNNVLTSVSYSFGGISNMLEDIKTPMSQWTNTVKQWTNTVKQWVNTVKQWTNTVKQWTNTVKQWTNTVKQWVNTVKQWVNAKLSESKKLKTIVDTLKTISQNLNGIRSVSKVDTSEINNIIWTSITWSKTQYDPAHVVKFSDMKIELKDIISSYKDISCYLSGTSSECLNLTTIYSGLNSLKTINDYYKALLQVKFYSFKIIWKLSNASSSIDAWDISSYVWLIYSALKKSWVSNSVSEICTKSLYNPVAFAAIYEYAYDKWWEDRTFIQDVLNWMIDSCINKTAILTNAVTQSKLVQTFPSRDITYDNIWNLICKNWYTTNSLKKLSDAYVSAGEYSKLKNIYKQLASKCVVKICDFSNSPIYNLSELENRLFKPYVDSHNLPYLYDIENEIWKQWTGWKECLARLAQQVVDAHNEVNTGRPIEEQINHLNNNDLYIQKFFASNNLWSGSLKPEYGAYILSHLTGWSAYANADSYIATWNTIRNEVNAIDDVYMQKVVDKMDENTRTEMLNGVGRYCVTWKIWEWTDGSNYTWDVAWRQPCVVYDEYLKLLKGDDSDVNKNVTKAMYNRADIYLYVNKVGSNHKQIVWPIQNNNYYYQKSIINALEDANVDTGFLK